MAESGRKLTIASASQNLNTKEERVVHRLIPMLVAENMTRLAEYESGEHLPRIDLWNCIGMRMDKSFEKQSEYTSRRDFSSALLKDKYTILEEFGIPLGKRKILRDDDESTKSWFNYKLCKLISSGIIYTRKMEVDICNNCDYLQALSGLHSGSCTRCDKMDFHSEKKDVLMLDIPEWGSSLTDGRIIHPRNINHIKSFFDQLPPRIMISKMRRYGLSLDSFGLPDYVLDPKMGVALMPELAAEIAGSSKITFVQGAAIAANNLLYTSIMTSGFDHSYVLLPKIPPMTLDEARKLGLGFVGRHLPLVLMEHNENMTPAQLETVRQEYYRFMGRINAVVPGLQSGKDPIMSLDAEEHQMISEVIKDFMAYRVKQGRKKLNLFIRSQGRRYAEKLKRGDDCCLNKMDANTLEEIINLFYR